MVWHRQKRGTFLLEAAVVLLLLMAAAGSIAHFAAVTTRARQQQWIQFQQETQMNNIVERLRQAAPAQRESMASRLMEDNFYGRPRIEIEAIEVDGVAGQHIVITPGAADSLTTATPTEIWQFDLAEAEPDDAEPEDAESDDADAEEEGDDDE